MKQTANYSPNFGTTYYQKGDNTYNGYSINQIEKMQFNGWIEQHKQMYIDNCKRVIECQLTGYNSHDIEYLKNTNFNLVKHYEKYR
jgi:hypothetical protein